jgi:para-aminobenzoate synthetase/4-amino-4-deoxychorismate lyase
LGKISIPGSVQVSRLFEVERFETLWQMTSTVESTLYCDVSLADVMKAVFPCGSITGAPKIRTMEIIRDLESGSRGIYTGTIGLIRPGGDCEFNVAIRTVVIDSQTGIATFGVGGGITIDSTAEQEYEECLLKSSFLNSSATRFRLLETILLEHGQFFLLERHLERLKTSADYFGFQFSASDVLTELNRTASRQSSGSWKVRLLLAQDGEVKIESTETKPDEQRSLRVCLAPEPVDSSNRFLFHKTTNRKIYDEACAARPDCDDVILWNERGEVTESTVANVVVSIDGQLYTPPLESGLLAGTLRSELLVKGRIRERFIRVEELQEISHFFLINSVRKWTPARLFV